MLPFSDILILRQLEEGTLGKVRQWLTRLRFGPGCMLFLSFLFMRGWLLIYLHVLPAADFLHCNLFIQVFLARWHEVSVAVKVFDPDKARESATGPESDESAQDMLVNSLQKVRMPKWKTKALCLAFRCLHN